MALPLFILISSISDFPNFSPVFIPIQFVFMVALNLIHDIAYSSFAFSIITSHELLIRLDHFSNSSFI